MNHTTTAEQLLRHLGWLQALARQLVRDDDLADDLVQETLLTAIERPPRVRQATGAWLRRVLRNLAYRAHRRRLRRERRERLAAVPEKVASTPDGVLERVELEQRLVDIVLGLGEPYRSSLLLHFFEGLSTQEIAARLDVDVTTVRWRVRRALEQVRQRLDREHGGRGVWCSVLLPVARPQEPSGGSGASGGITGAWVAGAAAMKVKATVVAAFVSLFLLALVVRFVQTPEKVPGRERQVSSPVAAEKAAPPLPGFPLIAVPPAKLEAEPARQPARAGPVVAGLVLEAETGAPLAGAVVRVRGSEHRATTDQDGAYRLAGLPPGDHFLVAGGETYAESNARIRLAEEKEFRQDFSLDPAIEVLLTVAGEDGQPIEDVIVTRSQPAGDYVHSDEYSRRTGADGRAVVPGINRANPQQLHAKKEGYRETWWKDYRFDRARDFAEGTIVLQKAPGQERAVDGRVSARDGTLLAGVSVQWIHSWGPSKGREIAVTDARGLYRLRFESQKDVHPIGVFGSGWAPLIRGDVRTGTPESPARVDFTLEKGHWLGGRVVDEDMKPVGGVVLKAMPELGSLRNPNIQPGIVREATTDDSGMFSLEDLSGPTVAIRLFGPPGGGWANNVHELVAVDTRVELAIERWSLIRGRVIDDDTGEPVLAFRIQVEGGGKGYLEYARMNPGESFDAPDGRFVLQRLDPDEYDLTVHAEQYLSKRLERVAAGPAVQAEEIEARMTVGRGVEGWVIDGDSRLALPQAKVVFGVRGAGEPSWSGWDLEHLRHRQEAVTGADGTFRFIEDDPGTVFIRAPGHARLCVPPGDRQRFSDGSGRLIVALTREAVLAGVHYQEGRPCRTGFFVPILLADPASSGVRERLESIDRDGEGRFRVEGLHPGFYWLDHYRETPGKVSAGMGTRRRLKLEPGENRIEYGRDLGDIVFSGRLMDRDGSPVDGAHVNLLPAFDWEYVRFSAKVDREHEGHFWIGGLRAGTYGVEVEGRDGQRIPLSEIELAENTERDLTVAALSAESPR